MALVEIKKDPTQRELRTFGLMFVAFAGVLGLSVLWRRHSLGAAEIIWAIGATIGALYFLVAPLRRWIYLGWCYLTYPIGWVVSHVIMVVTFYLAVTPVALILRLLGKDLLEQRFDRSAATYWTPRRELQVDRYFRQF
jgi:hypothetical protein